ncbi:hypothetical protein D3C81_897630 [compost metagenome]
MRGGLHQHCTRHGPHATHLLIGIGHRTGATGALETERQIFIDVGINRRGNHPHLRPIGVQLFGDQCRHAGIHPLAHLGMFTDNGDNAFLINLHEGIGCMRIVFRRRGGVGSGQRTGRRQIGTDHQRTGADDKTPPGKRDFG